MVSLSIQISINLGKTFLSVFLCKIFLWPESWQESLHSYLQVYISQTLDLIYWKIINFFDFNFDLRYFEWRECFVNYFQWTYLEGYSFIRLSCKKKILPWFVWWFNPLFISWHEAMPWSDAFCYLWIIHLHIQRNEPLLSILKQVKIQYQPPNGSSLVLIQSERGRGGGYSWEFLVGVICHMVLQILTL